MKQVKFVQTTQSVYDALASKDSGTLYFIIDTQRIYKGSELYGATTVDQAIVDSIEASAITVDGSNVSLEGHTHSFGDIVKDQQTLDQVIGGIQQQLVGLEETLHIINNGEVQ